MNRQAASQTHQETQTPALLASGILQRKCDCGQQTIAGSKCTACSKEREATLQRSAINQKPVNGHDNGVPSIVHDVLRSPGQPLDTATRAFFEPRFGHDFSRVRVHTDAKAAESAQAVHAQAYTVASDIVFGAGRHAPTTREGQRLLAHELTHVVQQLGMPVMSRRDLALAQPDTIHEREAEAIAESTLHGDTGLVASGETNHAMIQRSNGSGGLHEVRSQPQKEKKGEGKKQDEGKKEVEPKIELAIGGVKETVDPKKVTSGIWWLNGATPSLPGFYPTEANIRSGLPASGEFKYSIVKGGTKLGIVSKGAVVSSMTVKDPSVTVRGIGASTAKSDVELQIAHTAPKATKADIYTAKLEVRAPNKLNLLKCSHAPKGTFGFKSMFHLKVLDNFGVAMPYIDVNEDFTSGTLDKGVSSDYSAPFTSRAKGQTITHGDATFDDEYGVDIGGGSPPATMVPTPSNPKKPLGSTAVGTFTHWWYAGSATTANGVKVSEHTAHFYSDHGQYAGFHSPPAAGKGENCP